MKSPNVVFQHVQLEPYSLFSPWPAKLMSTTGKPAALLSNFGQLTNYWVTHPPSIQLLSLFHPAGVHVDCWSPDLQTQVSQEESLDGSPVYHRAHTINSHTHLLHLERKSLKCHRTMTMIQFTNTPDDSGSRCFQ